jgi:inner membrane protein involved in colicin E2 resistance
VRISEQAARSGVFGVEFLRPTDVYQQTHRALRYAVLFLFIPFAALFLLETLSKRRLHAVQYILVGLANCVFYLLLLALAEHIPFLAAYLISGAAVSVLTAFYVHALIPGGRTARTPSRLWPAIRVPFLRPFVEDYALLIGSLGLFLLVAFAMIVTRKVDWYGVEGTGTNGKAVPTQPSRKPARRGGCRFRRLGIRRAESPRRRGPGLRHAPAVDDADPDAARGGGDPL